MADADGADQIVVGAAGLRDGIAGFKKLRFFCQSEVEQASMRMLAGFQVFVA